VASHYEAVHEVPSGFRVTASRPHVPIDGLEHEELPIFTWQFHPEGRDRFATKVGLDPEGIDIRLMDDSRRLLAAFCALAAPIPRKKKRSADPFRRPGRPGGLRGVPASRVTGPRPGTSGPLPGTLYRP